MQCSICVLLHMIAKTKLPIVMNIKYYFKIDCLVTCQSIKINTNIGDKNVQLLDVVKWFLNKDSWLIWITTTFRKRTSTINTCTLWNAFKSLAIMEKGHLTLHEWPTVYQFFHGVLFGQSFVFYMVLLLLVSSSFLFLSQNRFLLDTN